MVVERCSLAASDGILEEILQSSDKFQLFDVDWADSGGGQRWRGVWWTHEVVVGQR